MMVLTILGILLGMALQIAGTVYSYVKEPKWQYEFLLILSGAFIQSLFGSVWTVIGIILINLVVYRVRLKKNRPVA